MKIKISYKELHKLFNNDIKMSVDTPNGVKEIKNIFEKEDDGYELKYDDGTNTKCSITHHMSFNGEMQSSSELNVGDVCSNSGKIIIEKNKLKKQKWLDFEVDHESGLYYQNNIIHHNSGKSCIIFLVLNFLFQKKMNGYLVVPNINLLTQLYSDFESYFKEDSEYKQSFLSTIEKQGGGHNSTFDSFLTISTWQSAVLKKDVLARADFIICDECHKYKSDVSGSIIKESTNAKYKWGFTGTMPEEDLDKLELMGIFGKPRVYMTSKELIERGLGTPIKINSIHLLYNETDKSNFRRLKNYQQQLTFIKEHEKRTKFIVNLSCKIKEFGNTMLLFSHVEHMKTTFIDIMKRLYPDVVVENKNITGKNSFNFQKQYGVYFLNGEDDGDTREKTRKILEEQFFKITLEDETILRLYETDLVKLTNGSYKLVKDLTEEDDVCEDYLKGNKNEKRI